VHARVADARRKGLYPVKDFPAVLGTEAAGVIAALPTDAAVLAHPEYKKRGFAVGGKVAVVRLSPPPARAPG
jgi:NADPH2:quinone reductase